jgi:hypothetical protein
VINGNRMKSNRGRSPRDLYITPFGLANTAIIRFSLDEIKHPNYSRYSFGLDVGCGNGVWGKAATNIVAIIDGIDIVPSVSDNDIHLFGQIFTGNFLELNTNYDFIFGNPPYSLAEEFVRHSFKLLEPNGYIYFLLRLSFLEGIARGNGLFKEFPPKHVYVCSRRPSFFSTNGKHTTDTLAYAMFLWQKNYQGKTELDFLDWEYSK